MTLSGFGWWIKNPKEKSDCRIFIRFKLIYCPVRQKDDEKRQSIREATFELVAENGISGLKMAQLARKVNLSPSTLYVYFRDKEDLILTLFREVVQSMLNESISEFLFDQPFKDNLRRIWRNYLNFRINHYPAIAFYENVKTSPYFSQSAQEVKTVEMQGALELIRYGQSQNLLKDVDPQLLLETLGGMTDRMSLLMVQGKVDQNEDNMEICFNLMWDSISVRQPNQNTTA